MTKPADVTGGKKTMKRRQQIRELIEHHDVANEEEMDFFNATPGRTNKNKVCNFSNAKLRRLKFLMHETGFQVVLQNWEKQHTSEGIHTGLETQNRLNQKSETWYQWPHKKDICPPKFF